MNTVKRPEGGDSRDEFGFLIMYLILLFKCFCRTTQDR